MNEALMRYCIVRHTLEHNDVAKQMNINLLEKDTFKCRFIEGI